MALSGQKEDEMQFSPFTGLGQLQLEVTDVRRMVQQKAESYEIHSVNNRMDSLEHSLRQISSDIAELQHRIEEMQEDKING
jgi:peptidoglycan hydrolase CwlO-like protein